MTDFPEETRTATVQSNGTLVAKFPASSNPREIERVVINGPVNSVCLLYVGAISINFLRDGSATGQQDIGEYPRGLYVPAGSPVFLVWNATTSEANAHIQWKRT